jgi:diguanylate cyclase (GGDEF)-like protein
LNQLVPLSACALFVYEKETETLRCRAARGVDSNLLKQLTLRNSAGVNGWVARHRRPVTNAFARWDLQLLSADLSSVKLQSAAAWPLVVNERLIGTLGLYHVEPDYYTEERCLPLERAAERIAAVVNNALVFEQTQAESLTDPLTRLPNARQLFSFVHDELARADEQTHPVSLIIFDVDNFKRVNDQYGHDAGNRALCMVARGLSGAVRSTDLCARYAGDEFVVVLSGSDWAAAESKRVQICRAVEQMAFEVRPGVLTRVSVSSGVATLSSECRTYDDLLAEADRRMYDDKARRQALATA